MCQFVFPRQTVSPFDVDVARDGVEQKQGSFVLGSVHMFRYSSAGDRGGRFGGGKFDADPPDFRSLNPADLLCPFRAILLEVTQKLIRGIIRPILQESSVIETLLHDHFGHRQSHRGIRAGLYGEPFIAFPRRLREPHVKGDQLGAEIHPALDDPLDEGDVQKVSFIGISPKIEDVLAVGYIVDACLRPHGRLESGLLVETSQRGMVQSRGRPEGVQKAVRKESVCDIPGTVKYESLGMTTLPQFHQSLRNLFVSLFPGDAPPIFGPSHSLSLDGVEDPIRVVNIIDPRLTLCAQFSPAIGMLGVSPDFCDPSVFGVADDSTTGITLKTGTGDSLAESPGRPGDTRPSPSQCGSTGKSPPWIHPGEECDPSCSELQKIPSR